MSIRNPKQLGEALRRERRRQGLTQSGVAEKVGLHQPAVSVVEDGKPRSELRIVFELLAALGLEMTLRERNQKDKPRIEDIF